MCVCVCVCACVCMSVCVHVCACMCVVYSCVSYPCTYVYIPMQHPYASNIQCLSHHHAYVYTVYDKTFEKENFYSFCSTVNHVLQRILLTSNRHSILKEATTTKVFSRMLIVYSNHENFPLQMLCRIWYTPDP